MQSQDQKLAGIPDSPPLARVSAGHQPSDPSCAPARDSPLTQGRQRPLSPEGLPHPLRAAPQPALRAVAEGAGRAGLLHPPRAVQPRPDTL